MYLSYSECGGTIGGTVTVSNFIQLKLMLLHFLCGPEEVSKRALLILMIILIILNEDSRKRNFEMFIQLFYY